MATIFLDRVDAAPVINNDTLDAQLLQWMWVLVDTLNENIADIQNAFNLLRAMSYTAAEIVQFQASGLLVDGALLYDTTNNLYVGRRSGLLVKFTTTAYP